MESEASPPQTSVFSCPRAFSTESKRGAGGRGRALGQWETKAEGAVRSDQRMHPNTLFSNPPFRANVDPTFFRALHTRLPQSLSCGCPEAQRERPAQDSAKAGRGERERERDPRTVLW